jgi:hypothetical protein
MADLLTDSATRGFAISFLTARRVAALNATLLFFGGITPSSCHTPKRKNGQFRPGEQDSGGAFLAEGQESCAGKSAQQLQFAIPAKRY